MAKPLTKKSELTRLAILDAATDLFNKKGTRDIHTHHIAAAAGLSPGNLYYHFRDKEEIVRAIFEKIELYSNGRWESETSHAEENAFYNFLEFFFSQLNSYRFFFREQAELIRADAKLAAGWRKAHAELSEVWHRAARHWVKLGILIPFESAEEIDAFINNCWIVAGYSHAYLESRGATREARESQHLVAYFLRPYHTTKGKKLLDSFFNDRTESRKSRAR